MRKITIAPIATLTATLVSAPAFATGYGNGYGSYGHSHSHGHSYGYNSYTPTYHAPSYHAPAYVAPAYHAPQYVAPVYVAPTTTYETRPAYVYQKVAGYCTEKVISYGYGHDKRHTVECKAGEKPVVIEKAPEVPAEPPK